MSRSKNKKNRRANKQWKKQLQQRGQVQQCAAQQTAPQTEQPQRSPYETIGEHQLPFPAASARRTISNQAIIYRSELDFVSKCILDYPRIETGGQMFGYWTDNGTPVVLYTIGPGPNANHQTAFFNQDLTYLRAVGNVLTRKYGLQHIGEWHSHHQLGLAHPSGHDAASMANGLAASHRERFLLCIGNCTNTTSRLNPFNFAAGYGTEYVDAQWVVKDIDSPFRALIDRELKSMLFMPDTQKANYEGMPLKQQQPASEPRTSYASGYWLADKSNHLILKGMIDYLNQDPNVSNLKPMLDGNQQVNLTFIWQAKYTTVISFPDGFPHNAPRFKVCEKKWDGTSTDCEILPPQWNYYGDILTSFKDYYNNLRIL